MSPLTLACDLHLAGLRKLVRLLNCGHLLTDLTAYLPAWPFTMTEAGDAPATATLALSGKACRLTS